MRSNAPPLLLLPDILKIFLAFSVTLIILSSTMSIDGPFLDNPSVLPLSSYHNAKRGIACICEGLIFLGKATGELLIFFIFLAGLGFALLVVLPFRLALYLLDWMKPDHIDTLPRFEPREKTL
jgi:hypothetical protein